MAQNVFGLLEMLNRSLQARYQTVSGMLTAVDETLSSLRDLHVNAAFDKLLADTEEIVVELDLEALTVPGQRQPPKRYTGDAVPHVAITVSDYYRPLYFELVDTTVQQLENRFHSNASLLKYQALENVLLTEECGDVQGNLNLSVYTKRSVGLICRFRLSFFVESVLSNLSVMQWVSSKVWHQSYAVNTTKWNSWSVCFSSHLLLPRKLSEASAPFAG